ncbi:MAG TPA: ArsA family ATPase, partial [Pseudomonadota bacterium]|nr:ArsA family ATPase [Pseudomonadota bacterium]
MPAACPALPFLTEPAALRLILFAGKGGVGKTTCAAATALGLAAAEPTQSFLVVSVDPAHSLRDAFAAEPPPANLTVVELDAAACLAEFLDRHRETLREIARRGTFLDEQDVQRFVDLSLPGMDELFAFLRIAAWSAAARYRTVIVDTAPSGHTHRLLAVPRLLGGFVQALHALLAKHRYLVEHYRGAYQPDHTDALLAELAESAASTQRLLGSPHSCLVPVLLAESLSVAETGRFLAQLAEQRVRVGPLLVNRLRPPSDCPQCRLLQRLQDEALQRGAALLAGRELWGLPLLPAEV